MSIRKIGEYLAKLSKACGLEERVESASGKGGGIGDGGGGHSINGCYGIEDIIDLEADGAEALHGYLSYRDFDSHSGLFFGEDDTVGFMLELSPIVGTNEALLKNLNLFFNKDLPEGGYLQFLLVANHDIGGVVSRWQAARSNDDPVLQKFTSSRRDFLLHQASNFKDQDGRLPRNFQVFISFSKKMKLSEMRGISGIKRIEDFKAKMLAKLSSFKLQARECNAEELIELACNLLQMRRCEIKGTKSRYDKFNLLSRQILTPLKKLKLKQVDGSLINDEGFVTRSYYVTQFPDSFSLSAMINLLGLEEGHLGINARFAISYTVANDLGRAAQSSLLTKGDRIIHAADQWYSRNNRDIRREAAEWREVNDMHKNGELFLTENFQVLLSANEEDINKAEQNLLSLYNIHDWKIEPNKNLHLIALLSMLPMQQPAYFPALKHFQLTKTILSHEAVAKLPIHAEWKGVPMPGVLMQGRRGQLFNWNPFYRISSGNYNACIMAASGGGKSVFLQELATTMLAQNARVFILDIGGSYANICELMNGEMISFKHNSNISLNPFAELSQSGAYIEESMANDKNPDNEIEVIEVGNYKVSKDSIIYAQSIVSAMCGVANDLEKVAVIYKAISRGIEEYGHELDITKLSKVLESMDAKGARELGTSLYPYTEGGVHGKYFKGRARGQRGKANGKDNSKDSNEVTFKNRLTVFEFEEIKNDQGLLSVILQVIMMQIFLQVLCGDRKTRFILIVEEAWKILSHAAGFMAEPARTFRKYNGSLITCVQNFSDLQGTPERSAILENSTWSLLLKQDEKGLSAFKESEAFKDMLPLIESISMSPGKYAEVLFCATDIAVVGRLCLDPYLQAAFSTDPADFEYLKKAKALGLSKDEAIERLAKAKYEADK